MTPPTATWGTMEGKSPALYSLMSDRTPAYGKWLPTKVPDGKYGSTPAIVEPTCTGGASSNNGQDATESTEQDSSSQQETEDSTD